MTAEGRREIAVALADLRGALRRAMPADLACEGAAACLFIAGLVRQAELREMPDREVREAGVILEKLAIGDRRR